MSSADELLALALAMNAESADSDRIVAALVEQAEGSPGALLSAHARAQALAEQLPYDANAQAVLEIVTQALKQPVTADSPQPAQEALPIDPGVVAGVDAETLEHDLDRLRATATVEPPARRRRWRR